MGSDKSTAVQRCMSVLSVQQLQLHFVQSRSTGGRGGGVQVRRRNKVENRAFPAPAPDGAEKAVERKKKPKPWKRKRVVLPCRTNAEPEPPPAISRCSGKAR